MSEEIVYNLPFGIVVRVKDGSGTIESDLKKDTEDDPELNAALDCIEAFILGHACSGIKIDSPAYIETVESVVETIFNKIA